jgi:peptidoglycan/LPS O-acetylase OafA/YrhL
LLSIGVSALSFKYFETPILKLKDRIFRYWSNNRDIFWFYFAWIEH